MNGRPFALDFGAVMTMGGALGVDLEMLASALPGVEAAIVGNLADRAEDPVEQGED